MNYCVAQFAICQDVKEGAFSKVVSSNSILKIIAQHNLLFVKMLMKGLFPKLFVQTRY